MPRDKESLPAVLVTQACGLGSLSVGGRANGPGQLFRLAAGASRLSSRFAVCATVDGATVTLCVALGVSADSGVVAGLIANLLMFRDFGNGPCIRW
jgi:hypothetical protein